MPIQIYISGRDDTILLRMKEAYGLLFTIENALRDYIADRMIGYYGHNWQVTAPRQMYFRQRPFTSLQFYHLENYLRVYPCFTNTDTLIRSLRLIYPIRNQIAHSHELTEDQFNILNTCFIKIMDIF